MKWEQPYPSARSPVFAGNMVATSQPLAAQSGIEILHQGGNAVDAALATAITLTVVEPNNNGIGSDAFALIWDGKTLHGLNASGKSPRAWSPERFKHLEKMPVLGWDAVTVPGAVSAWVEMSNKFGKLPFESLFAPAIHYASNGYLVGPKTGYYWKLAENTYNKFEAFRNTFLPKGKAPDIGQLITLPDHAKSLASIAKTHGASFYQGELATAMIKDSEKQGGAMTLEDLSEHKAEWINPISQCYTSASQGKIELHEIPPNGQGLMVLVALGILDYLNIGAYPADSAHSVHLQIEAMRSAYAEIERHLADLAYMKVTTKQLLAADYLKLKADKISMDTVNSKPSTLPSSPDTVYLTSADQSGMMVSMIQSNYRGFGSGIVIPGTGISLQNRGCGFTLEDGHPNQVGGAKKPYHTIIPGFVTQKGHPLLSFGVMGGHMQAQGHVQMVVRLFDYNQNPQAASDAPRWHLMEDGRVALEEGFDPRIAEDLGSRGHQLVLNNPPHIFGGAQLISCLQQGYCGASDHRKEGLALGF